MDQGPTVSESLPRPTAKSIAMERCVTCFLDKNQGKGGPAADIAAVCHSIIETEPDAVSTYVLINVLYKGIKSEDWVKPLFRAIVNQLNTPRPKAPKPPENRKWVPPSRSPEPVPPKILS
jgi:hypothetical protein